MSLRVGSLVSKRSLLAVAALAGCSALGACATSRAARASESPLVVDPTYVAAVALVPVPPPRVVIAAPPPAGTAATAVAGQAPETFTPVDSPLLGLVKKGPHGDAPPPMDALLVPERTTANVRRYDGSYGYTPYYDYAPTYGYWGPAYGYYGYYGYPRMALGVGIAPYGWGYRSYGYAPHYGYGHHHHAGYFGAGHVGGHHGHR